MYRWLTRPRLLSIDGSAEKGRPRPLVYLFVYWEVMPIE